MVRAMFSRFRRLVSGLGAGAPLILAAALVAQAQVNNSVTGYVTGNDRRPVPDLIVELLDDYRRTLARTRTTSSGYYEFEHVPAGNFTVRIFTFGTDYEEQEQSGEILNFESTTASGQRRITGSDRQQKDFQLRPRRGVVPSAATSIFAQDVPPAATKLYEKALVELEAKRTDEGLQDLRAAIEIFPRYFAALERLGTEYLLIGRPETVRASVVLLGLAVEVNSRSFKSWYGLAYARHFLQEYPEATKAVEKAIEINPSSVDALLLYGRLLRNANKYTEAEKQLVKAKGLSPAVPTQLHWELALLYGRNLEKYADAAEELRSYLKLLPDTPKAEEIKRLIADYEAKGQKK